MIYAVLGFIFGLCIPYIARRFEKFMPATAAYAIYRILKPNKSVSRAKKNQNHRYVKLMRAYRSYSVGWAIVVAAVSYLTYVSLGANGIVWNLILVWTLLLLTEIDKRMLLLPDILTIPLLIIGFAYSTLSVGLVIPAESALGAMAGYFLPVVASMLLVWRHKDVFGGGDIKLLAAVGAWIGLESLLYTVILSCVLFGAYALLNRKREGAFGPAIVLATLIVIFISFQ